MNNVLAIGSLEGHFFYYKIDQLIKPTAIIQLDQHYSTLIYNLQATLPFQIFYRIINVDCHFMIVCRKSQKLTFFNRQFYILSYVICISVYYIFIFIYIKSTNEISLRSFCMNFNPTTFPSLKTRRQSIQTFLSQKSQFLDQKMNQPQYFGNQLLEYHFDDRSKEIPTQIMVQKPSFEEIFSSSDYTIQNNQVVFQSNIQRQIDNDQRHIFQIEIEHAEPELEGQFPEYHNGQVSIEGSGKINKQKRTDQYLFKRRHTILKKCLSSLQLRHFIKTYKSYRKDYFLLILNLIEEQGMLTQLKQKYCQKAIMAIRQINQELKKKKNSRKIHLEKALKVIKNSVKTVQLFCEGKIHQAFDLIYDLGKLTRIQDYENAKKNFSKERRKLNLQNTQQNN